MHAFLSQTKYFSPKIPISINEKIGSVSEKIEPPNCVRLAFLFHHLSFNFTFTRRKSSLIDSNTDASSQKRRPHVKGKFDKFGTIQSIKFFIHNNQHQKSTGQTSTSVIWCMFTRPRINPLKFVVYYYVVLAYN